MLFGLFKRRRPIERILDRVVELRIDIRRAAQTEADPRDQEDLMNAEYPIVQVIDALDARREEEAAHRIARAIDSFDFGGH